ncbi:hypothetical protein LOAG_08231 [Loa loa]|uniref:Uncharacterized protein n=1 Tax=Loa loa TaxID=7209 RepID=A0A1S0TU53_LOALO|nr:hypothetical protein LOAG_08231 [Loa loa]EFO20260.1 hypothetical protein LOAG_08231 [Loa loa]
MTTMMTRDGHPVITIMTRDGHPMITIMTRDGHPLTSDSVLNVVFYFIWFKVEEIDLVELYRTDRHMQFMMISIPVRYQESKKEFQVVKKKTGFFQSGKVKTEYGEL